MAKATRIAPGVALGISSGIATVGSPIASAAEPSCRLDNSVYAAEVIDEGFGADELRFSFEPLGQVRYDDDLVQQLVVTSPKMGTTLRFGTSVTN